MGGRTMSGAGRGLAIPLAALLAVGCTADDDTASTATSILVLPASTTASATTSVATTSTSDLTSSASTVRMTTAPLTIAPSPGIEWHSCGDPELHCGSLTVPLDPDDPSSETVALSVVRRP